MTTTTRNSIRLVPAIEVSEGAGVTVWRSIGSPALRNLDPFLMLDAFNSDNPDDYIAGFPPHPHRGFSTFTYMVDGHFEHQDSMGNTGHLGPGGGQWMKAGSGVIHSEMPKQEGGLMRGFQLWINLPAANKMDKPEYQEFQAEAFPVIDSDDYQVRLIIGQYAGRTAPIIDEHTAVIYLDIALQAGKTFDISLPQENNMLLYLFAGEASIGGQRVTKNTLVIPGNEKQITAGKQGARFILLSGRPINEPVVQYGPFVMNTREEIDQAVKDYQSNNFVRDRAWIKKDSRGNA